MRTPRSGLLAVVGCAVAALAFVGCGRIPTDIAPPPAAPSGTETAAAPEPPSASATTSPKPSRSPSPSPRPKPAGPDCAKLKCIALTYDDGPYPDQAAALATTLRQHKVKATFFMLGQNVENHPDAVKQIAATGSEVANHSWSHANLSRLGLDGMQRELKRTNDAIAKATGAEPTLMRPPYGANNRRLDKVCRQLGVAEIYWNVDTNDYQNRDTEQLITYVLGNAARNRVVLMHDIYPTTVAAAPEIIAGLKAQGYTLVTVSELFPKLRPGGHYPEWQGRGFAQKSDYPPGTRER